jgi:hypothetical protein
MIKNKKRFLSIMNLKNLLNCISALTKQLTKIILKLNKIRKNCIHKI